MTEGGKTVRNRRGSSMIFMRILLSAILVLMVWGCGGSGPGSPGTQGTEDTGVILEATIIPTYNNVNTNSVDAFQGVCDVGPPIKYEVFTDHTATVTVSARLLNPNSTFQAGTLYIEKYTVEFRRSTDSIGAPPIESDTRYKSIIITPPTGAGTNTVTDTVILVDLIRKDKYRSDMLSGMFTSAGAAYLNNYTAIYTFEGKNQFGDSFSFTAQTDFQIGNFDNC
jgi:hypothetical protein